MKENQFLILGGIIAIIIAIIWSKQSKANNTTTSTPVTEPTTTPTVTNNVVSTPYDRYKFSYNKGVLLKSNVELVVKAAASENAPYITNVYPNQTLGRATGRFNDIDNFRWVEVELSSEVNIISSLRIKLMEQGLTRFWVKQEFISQVNSVSISNPFF